jgi:phosphate uptake regulator
MTSDGTFFVTLPKTWVTIHGIGRGTVLTFAEGKDGKLLLGPHGENYREPRTIKLNPGPTLEREIEEKYLLGHDIIEIESRSVLHSDVRDHVKAILKKLVGLEIVEEDAQKITIQCLIEPSLLAPERIIRRLHLMTKAMQRDAITAFTSCDTKLAKTVVERDEEVDRLYFLLVRIVRDALTDLTTAERIHASPVDCLDYRILSSLIEHFGDYSAQIAMNVPTPHQAFPKQLSRSLNQTGETINLMYTSAVEAVLSRNLSLISKVGELERRSLGEVKGVEHALLGLGDGALDETTSAISALKSMCEINVDIADLAMAR